jgi:hypothetical protein
MNSQFTISWSDIFSSDQYLYYEISAGSHEAGVNILQWQFTNETSVTFGIPLSVKLETGFNVFIQVRAISVGGFYQQKTGKFKIP